MSKRIGVKLKDFLNNKSNNSLQRIVDDLRREIDALKDRVSKLGG